MRSALCPTSLSCCGWAAPFRCVVEGRQRARLKRLWQTTPYLQANVEAIPEEPYSEAFQRSPGRRPCCGRPTPCSGSMPRWQAACPEEVLTTVMDSRDPGFLADYIAQNINLRYTDKQEILEEFSPYVRLRKLQWLPGPGEQRSGFRA